MSITSYIFWAIVAALFYKFIVKNLMIYFKYKMKFGNKIEFWFYPLLGNFGILRRNFKEHGDSLWAHKNVQRTKPECKAIMIFNGFVITFMIIDTSY